MRIVAVDIGGTMIKSGLWNGETFVELRETDVRIGRRSGTDGACQRTDPFLSRF